jgi:hypothetical protein
MLTESKENKFYRVTKKSTEIGKNLLILSKNYPCSYSFYRNREKSIISQLESYLNLFTLTKTIFDRE